MRSILVIWFLLFSIVPVAGVSLYSVYKYEQAIDNELTQRLISNGREISAILADQKAILQQRREHYVTDPSFLYYLSIDDEPNLRKVVNEWMKTEIATGITLFGRTGQLLLSVRRNEKGELKEYAPGRDRALILAQETLGKLTYVNSYPLVEHTKNGTASLALLSKVANANGRHIGYLEQVIDLDDPFLAKMKEKLKVELIVLRVNGQVSSGTLPEFALYKKSTFEPYTRSLVSTYFDLAVRGEPHGFLVYPVSWGNSDFFIALGASKKEARAILKNVNLAFYAIVFATLGLVVVAIWLTSNAVVKPLWELVTATQNLQDSDQPVEIPVTSETEIGLLTVSFNQMSRNIVNARAELKNKIQELERANQEIKEAQSRLIHNSKMVSLGQLVAGVAHELNNPIGFIYSNMGHLQDYSDRLLR
ncbi:MAG: two-component sensor histidine kinase, partial [Bdellovibrio sp.]